MVNPNIGYWLEMPSKISLLNIADIKTPELRNGPVSAFLANARRCLAFAEFPGRIWLSGYQAKLAEIAASMLMYGTPNYLENLRPHNDGPEFWGMVIKILEGRVKPPFPYLFLNHTGFGAGTFQLADLVPDDLHGAYDTMMFSQLILCWSTFETLSGDLWQEALNAHPSLLSDLKGIQQDKNEEGKTVLLETIQMNQWDLRKLMGTILRSKFNFTVLEGIRRAYQSAFSKHETGVINAINDTSLDAISLLRNLIVHHSGLCDKKYEIGSARLNCYIPILSVGQNIGRLDKTIFTDLLPQFFKCCNDLIKSVDGWIVGHP